ncbi:hypothetical protein Glove_229g92 [Diversispora epigaea]|uniref:Uncharacterized protein n=1 Tax=Diversispora epigaea TaxID=1348612 RepID=A0A397IM61_9GLOM|nr:hypothetical protein Glove_229g92 [Diversispora epigaea]
MSSPVTFATFRNPVHIPCGIQTWFFADIEEVRINNPKFNPQLIPYENVRYTKQIVDNEYYTLHLARLRRFTVVRGVVALKFNKAVSRI